MIKRIKKSNSKIVIVVSVLIMTLMVAGVFSETYAQEPYDSIGQYKKIQSTEAGVNNYIKESRAKNALLSKDKMTKISTTITFSKPLTDQELIAYIKTHHIDAVQIQARALQDETRISVSTIYGEGFDTVSKQQLEKYPNSFFIGYTDIYAKIDYSNIEGIQKDKRTFIIDCSADEYFEGAKEKDGDKRNKHRKGNNRYAHSLTWMLEDLGAMPCKP